MVRVVRGDRRLQLMRVLHSTLDDRWTSGLAYEEYMGRWSRPLAARFVETLAVPPGERWLDVGCGTGAVVEAILRHSQPADIIACDPSSEFLDFARRQTPDPVVTFLAAGIGSLPTRHGGFGVVVSNLVLNFLADPVAAVKEMAAVAAPGGVVAATVWDYGGRMQLLRCFWDAAAHLDPRAVELDEGRRFGSTPAALASTFQEAGLAQVTTGDLTVSVRFPDFGTFWAPFLGGVGPAPAYVRSLTGEERTRLATYLAEALPREPTGEITLSARAWVVRGLAPRGARND